MQSQVIHHDQVPLAETGTLTLHQGRPPSSSGEVPLNNTFAYQLVTAYIHDYVAQ